jgi:hypothetical protein
VSKLQVSERDLLKYVDAVNMLAANVALDIKKGRKISPDTVLALSRFASAAERIKALSDALEERRSYEN